MVKPYTDVDEMKRAKQFHADNEESKSTFKTEMNVWEEQPTVHATEEVSNSEWVSSTHCLTRLEKIVHVVTSQDG